MNLRYRSWEQKIRRELIDWFKTTDSNMSKRNKFIIHLKKLKINMKQKQLNDKC